MKRAFNRLIGWIAHEWAILKPHSKVIAISIIGYTLSMDIDKVKNYVTPNLSQHPKLTTMVFGVLSLVALVQKPAVRSTIESMLEIKQTSSNTAEIRAIPMGDPPFKEN